MATRESQTSTATEEVKAEYPEPMEATAPAAPPALLSREAILSKDDREYEDVYVPQWGGMVRIKALNGKERDAIEATIVTQRGRQTSMNLANLRARLVAMAAIDTNWAPLFTLEDVTFLGNKNAGALDKVFAVAQRLAGMSQEDVETLVGNSAPPTANGSGIR